MCVWGGGGEHAIDCSENPELRPLAEEANLFWGVVLIVKWSYFSGAPYSEVFLILSGSLFWGAQILYSEAI